MILRDVPPENAIVSIFRETTTERLVSWSDASVLKANDMTLFEVQLLHVAEETKDKVQDSGLALDDIDGKWDARLKIMKNLADPQDQLDVMNKRYFESTQAGYLQASQAKVDEATRQADIATTKASEAAMSASLASTKANEASSSATASLNSANTAAANVAVATKNAVDAAATSATNAANSATLASTKATAAAGSATSAATKANEASNSATLASTKATAAAGSATNAANSATEAAEYASQASNLIGYTKNEADEKFTPIGTSYTKSETDGKFVVIGATVNNAVTATTATKATTALNIPISDLGGNIWIA